MSENNIHEAHFDFSGGVNQYPGRLLKADNELDRLENGELDTFGPVKKSKGFTQRGGAVNAGYQILGLVSAYKSDGTTKQIAICDEGASSDAYTYNPTNDTWTQHGLSLTSGSKAEFEYFLDGFFMVNFTEATRWNNLAAWSTTTNVTNAPKAKYIKQYLSRLYTAYTVDNGGTHPSRIVFSELPSGEPLTLTWNNSVNYFDVDPDDGDVLKGLEVNSNRLLIFKENSLHRYDTNTRYKVPGCPGTVSQRSIVNIQGWTLYFHSSGIWGYDGSTAKLLSRAIRDIVAGVTTRNLTNACAWGDKDHYYLYVGDVINNNANLSISKCLIDYDVSKNAFSWRSLSKEPTVFRSYRDDRSNTTYDQATLTYNTSEVNYNGSLSAEQRVYFGDNNGYVYHFNNGNMQGTSAISFSMETKDYILGNPSMWKLLQKIIIFCDGGRQVTIQFKLDDGNWQTLGKLKDNPTELIFPAGCRCRRIKFRVIESSSGDPFLFEGFDIYFTPDSLIE